MLNSVLLLLALLLASPALATDRPPGQPPAPTRQKAPKHKTSPPAVDAPVETRETSQATAAPKEDRPIDTSHYKARGAPLSVPRVR